jgi:hypothetical protein
MSEMTDPASNQGEPSRLSSTVLKQRLMKLPALLLGAAGVLALGVYDNLKGGVVEGIADWARYHLSSPIYVLEFTEPVTVDPKHLVLLPVGGTGQPAKLENVSMPPSPTRDGRTKYIEVTVYPGLYYIRLERTAGSGAQVLAQQVVRLGKPGEPAKVDTSESQWATVTALTAPRTGGKTEGTRWTLAPSDSEALAASDGRSAAILRAALSQLGIWEGGAEADKRAVAAYWNAAIAAGGTPAMKEGDPVYSLWGGAFLAWAVAQAGGKPPSAAASFKSWKDWGTRIEPSKTKPGMIVVVETGQRQAPTPSGLMVGVLLRQRADCVEMVTGNIADRVVVTCVHGQVSGFRSPD